MPDLFSFGQIVATPAALKATSRERMLVCLVRHKHGDWGVVDKDDWKANDAAVKEGTRIFSVYPIDESKPCEGGNRLWIITEADRSSTTVLLPEDY